MTDTFTDDLGVTHKIATSPRILSLVPSITELLFDLDLADNLVGRTQYCIHPTEKVDAIQTVGGTKKINHAKAKDLNPTHVLMNIDENPKSMADDLGAMGINVVATHPMEPDDNLALYELIGGIFDRKNQAAKLADEYTAAQKALGDRDAFPHMRVLYLIWQDPWMAVSADTYVANTLNLVNWGVVTPGIVPGQTGDAARYPKIQIANDELEDIDLILFSSEPYSFDEDDIDEFQFTFPDHAHKAHIIDGEMTSWYGSRAIKGLQYLGDYADRFR